MNTPDQIQKKIFISFLGNTRYSESIYQDEPGSPKKTFVQEVILDSLCTDWNENDSIYIICTSGENGSYSKNWEGKCSGSPLKEILQEKVYFPIVKPITLEESSENDMWAVFDKVYSLISNEGDAIYLDVTNAFRSFSVLASTLLQYAQYMKGASVKEIFYGLYDKQTQTSQVQRLASIIELQQCIEVASGVVKYGRFNKLSELLKDNKLYEASKALYDLDGQFAAIRGGDIKKGTAIKQLSNQRKAINKASLKSPVKNVLNHAIDNLKEFCGNECLENMLAAARWAFLKGMLPQAYTFGKEYINAKVVEILGDNFNPYKDIAGIEEKKKLKKYLEYINAIMALNVVKVNAKEFEGELNYFLENTLSVLRQEIIIQLREYYVDLNRYRNQICHAKDGAKYETLYTYFGETFEKCIAIIENYKSAELPQENQQQRLFINLSNHPSTTWSATQLMAAAELGNIIDMPFPTISESEDEEHLDLSAEILCDKIIRVAPSVDLTTVHIMGEMTFTYKMVNMLKQYGYTCIASTTKRIAEEQQDGLKVSKFEFCKFREY